MKLNQNKKKFLLAKSINGATHSPKNRSIQTSIDLKNRFDRHGDVFIHFYNPPTPFLLIHTVSSLMPFNRQTQSRDEHNHSHLCVICCKESFSRWNFLPESFIVHDIGRLNILCYKAEIKLQADIKFITGNYISHAGGLYVLNRNLLAFCLM